jgi:YD repeat-containing protein
MTDRERCGLRGAVRSCRLECRWHSRRSGAETGDIEEPGHTTILDFRPDGSLSRRLHQNPDGSEWRTTYEYSDAGRLTIIRTEGPSATVIQEMYEYDGAGRLLRVSTRNEDGRDRTEETYEYDASGAKSRTVHPEAPSGGRVTFYGLGVEGTDSAYGAPGATRFSTFYDYHGKAVKLAFYDLAGRELSRVEFRYDGSGRLIEEVQFHSEEVLPPDLTASLNPDQLQTVLGLSGGGGQGNRRTHVYDQRGNRIETRASLGQLGSHRKTASYNEQGDPVAEVSEDEQREYGVDQEGRLADSPVRETVSRTEARFRYNYDSHGNWLSKTVESRTTVRGEFSISSVERRTIEYFDDLPAGRQAL